MKRNLLTVPLLSTLTAAILAWPSGAFAQAVIHRYSFTESATTTAPGSATTITDSAGGANGTFYGVGAFTGSELTLPGIFYPNTDGTHNTNTTGFVQLPAEMVSSLPTNGATFEFWINWQGGPIWQEFMSFGEAAQPGLQLGGGHYLMLCPEDNSSLLHAEWFGVNGAVVLTAPELPSGVTSHVVFTHDQIHQKDYLYVNGEVVASASTTATFAELSPDPDEWLGCDEWQDPCFNGSYEEFRIWNGPLTPAQVQASYESGPTNASISTGSLVSIQLSTPTNTTIGAIIAPNVLGTYALLTNSANITGTAGITYSSGNTNVITVGADGNFHAVGAGTVTLQANYQSLSASLSVTVAQPIIALQHRYSFNGPVGSTTITDSVGTLTGTLVNGTSTASLNGVGQLILDGNESSAYVSLPSGILPNLTNATFEIWAKYNGNATWAELISLGTNNGLVGEDYMALIPENGNTGTLRWGINENGEVDVTGPAEMPVGTISNPSPVDTNTVPVGEVSIAVSYNYDAGLASLYVNGLKVASGPETKPLYTIQDVDNYLGQSQFYGSGDPYFPGAIDEFRILSGAETELQIAVDNAAGPNNIVTNPGALVSISLVGSNTVDAHGAGVPVSVVANFANITNVNISSVPTVTIASSAPGVATVVNGVVVPQNVGPATITATYNGLSANLNVTVFDTNAYPTLLHRWNFHDPANSSTINDSVGTIDGTVEGAAVLTGTELVMPSPNPVSAANGLPTAASGWVDFPAGEGLVTSLPNEASIEIWVVWTGGPVWQEMFDFGQAATPGYSLGGGQYLMVCPYDGSGGFLHAEWDQRSINNDDVTLQGPALEIGAVSQVVYTHDQDRQLDKLYRNGVLVATAANPFLWNTLPDTDNWMARDQWQDPMFQGSYLDFRFWNGALTAAQVASLYAAGPEAVGGPTLQISAAGNSINLEWPANVTGYTVQSSTNLATRVWTTVSGTPTVANGVNVLTVPRSPTSTFYRLNP